MGADLILGRTWKLWVLIWSLGLRGWPCAGVGIKAGSRGILGFVTSNTGLLSGAKELANRLGPWMPVW